MKAGFIGAGAAVAAVASFTHPFTRAADVVTAVPLIVVLVVTLVTMGSRGGHGDSPDTGPSKDGLPRPGPKWLVWGALVAAIGGWELYCFVSLPRVDHPTLSALIDMLDANAPGKFVAFILWLALGWFLVTS